MAERTSSPFSLDDFIPHHAGLVEKTFFRSLEAVSGLRRLGHYYQNLQSSESAWEFSDVTLKRLDICYQVGAGNLNLVPASGATVIVANHPFGAVEGVIMAHMLLQRRKDVKIMANGFLQRLPELSELFLGVDPYARKTSIQGNLQPVREALRWLKSDGLLVIFPAGDVAQLKGKPLGIHEGNWNRIVASLVRHTQAPVVPVHFSGRNSLAFHLLGKLHPRIRTLMLPRELLNKSHRQIDVQIGQAVRYEKLKSCKSDEDMLRTLRLKCEMLGQNRGQSTKESINRKIKAPMKPVDAEVAWKDIAEAVPASLLEAEVDALPKDACYSESGDLAVYCASAQNIPWVLKEIGRLREVTFRLVGEGTGKALDLDEFDLSYLHLFIWNRKQSEIVGAYRLGLVDEILPQSGKRGFYTYSLFKYSRRFLETLSPAIELGRSFIRPEYQRSFSPLLLLWKGIGQFVVANPKYVTLFGPVSISGDYTSFSQQLLVDFLRANLFDASWATQVRARRPYRKARWKPVFRHTGVDALSSLEEVSELISFVEDDDKGVPILLKQYIKLGGRMLGFNRDDKFNDCLDGLILVELTRTDPRILKKYMGKEGAEQFLQSQQHRLPKSA